MGLVAQDCDPGIRDVETGRPELQGHPRLRSNCDANLGCEDSVRQAGLTSTPHALELSGQRELQLRKYLHKIC